MEYKFIVSRMEQDDLREIWQQIKNYSSDKKELRPRKVGINGITFTIVTCDV